MKIEIYNSEGRPLVKKEMDYLEKLIDQHLVEVIKTSEGLAVRAFLVGRILADFALKGMTAEEIEVAMMPLTIRALAQKIGKLSRQEQYAVEFARQRSAENIVGMREEIRKQVAGVIRRGLQERKNSLKVSQELFQKFGEFNRDWRRIAITEANIASGEGYMQRLLEDQRIRKKEETLLLGQSAVDACPWCKANIHGKIFKLVPRTEAPLDSPNDSKWDTHIWPGKNNIGRAYSKRKWMLNPDGKKVLVPRPNSELAKPCFGEHPNGRCWWIPYYKGMPIGDDGYVEVK